MAGSPQASPIKVCNASNKCARKGHNVPTITIPCVIPEECAVVAWEEAAGGSFGSRIAEARH
jgi:hypothetical protein